MKRVTPENRGIQWGLTSFLEDLYFSDDVSLLSQYQEHTVCSRKQMELPTKQSVCGLEAEKQEDKDDENLSKK